MVYCTVDELTDIPQNGDNFTLVTWDELYIACGFDDEPTHEQVVSARLVIRPVFNP